MRDDVIDLLCRVDAELVHDATPAEMRAAAELLRAELSLATLGYVWGFAVTRRDPLAARSNAGDAHVARDGLAPHAIARRATKLEQRLR